MTIKLASWLLATAAACASLAGCDEKASTTPATNLPAPTFGSATVTGQVRFLGTPPELKIIDTSKCHEGAKPVLDETIVVGANQGLKDVVVYIKNAPASDGSEQPMLELDQENCIFTPRVLPIQVNQKLKVKNSDPVFHNSRWDAEKNSDVNINLTPGQAPETTAFTHAEFLRVRCDVHSWMVSWIAVMENPFFATTARDGTFTIAKLPPGEYTVATWHPILGEREQAITVSESGTTPLMIDYAPPAKP